MHYRSNFNANSYNTHLKCLTKLDWCNGGNTDGTEDIACMQSIGPVGTKLNLWDSFSIDH